MARKKCVKIAFIHYKDALNAMVERNTRHTRKEVYVYKCKKCHKFHLTSHPWQTNAPPEYRESLERTYKEVPIKKIPILNAPLIRKSVWSINRGRSPR